MGIAILRPNPAAVPGRAPWKVLGSAGLLALLAGAPFSAARAQAPCPPDAAELVAQGWARYRAGAPDSARALFRRADGACARNLDAKVGLGFVSLRQGREAEADSLFTLVSRAEPSYADAWQGLATAAWRRGDLGRARDAARRALALAPDNAETRALLARVDPDHARPPLTPRRRPDTLELVSRVRPHGFEVRIGAAWTPMHLKGVNLGVALPGKFPSEFPADSARYAGWLDTLGAMHANVVRVYTILPPAFYRALRAHNLAHPSRPLWLVHGVWTELPPKDDFDDPRWKAEFRAEMRRVVDLLHGQADLLPRPGHAAGRYDADVSAWTLAYIIGREWEPYAVRAYDRARPARAHAGRFLAMERGPAMDAWMAEQCDYLLAYEFDTYHALRPIAYTNWPTLDPLTHPTESSTLEERKWRARAGRPFLGSRLEYENDAIGLDANRVRPTAANPAGWFASYHAYPYYPDFMLHDPGYLRARSSEGPSTYFGYLQALRRHHGDVPVVIAEYGVPSSRGVAHLQPNGWHHGGHDEAAMAAIDARLAREIREAGLAGGILFAWLDEWFKKNWVVIDFELPEERNRFWHSTMDAEQNYGILALLGGGADRPEPGGPASAWRALEAHQAHAGGTLRLGADPSYLYVALELPGRRGQAFPWDSLDVHLALDTWRADLGQRRLPGGAASGDVGFEFVAIFRDTADAELRVTPDYNRHAKAAAIESNDDAGLFFRRPITSRARSDGAWDSLFVTINRARFGRDGTFFPARGVNRGRLRFGRASASTLSDWYWDAAAGTLQLRLAWDLLNVSDPSSRTILFETRGAGAFGTVRTPGVQVGAALAPARGGPPVAAWPATDARGRWRAADFARWAWPTWDEPRYHQRLKPVYDSLQALWKE